MKFTFLRIWDSIMRTILSSCITVCEMVLHNTTRDSSITFYNIQVPKPSRQKKYFCCHSNAESSQKDQRFPWNIREELIRFHYSEGQFALLQMLENFCKANLLKQSQVFYNLLHRSTFGSTTLNQFKIWFRRDAGIHNESVCARVGM